MIKIKLPDMVKKVSSLVKNQPVTHSVEGLNLLTISTPIWEFKYTLIKYFGFWIYDSTTIVDSDSDSDQKNKEIYQKIKDEILDRYCIIF
jgi:hypothetical protein